MKVKPALPFFTKNQGKTYVAIIAKHSKHSFKGRGPRCVIRGDSKEEIMVFKKGDKVRWTSQSCSYTTTKEGIIIAVVPAGERGTEYGYRPNGGIAGYARNHISYVVKVKSKTYWPRVSQLQLVK